MAQIDAETVPLLSAAVIPLPQFTLVSFAGFIEALRHAADEGDRSRQVHCRWTVLAPDLRPIRSSCGVEVTPWDTLRDPAAFDYIVVVGGLLSGHERIHPAIANYLCQAAAKGVSLVGLCTGTFLLARAGLLRRRRCCVHWFHLEQFRQEFNDIEPVIDELFVIDRGRITCSGGTGAIDVAMHLIRQHCGLARAMKSMRQMVVDRARNCSDPQPLVGAEGLPDVADPLVRRALLVIEQHLAQPLSVTELAHRLGTNERRLHRAFLNTIGVPPAAFSRNLRLRHGRWLVRQTRRPISDIALECGFADASHFTRSYHRNFLSLPSADRSAAGGSEALAPGDGPPLGEHGVIASN